ncbi:MAG: alkaline phosphatase D family protein [Verrucomicrobiota bacterium]
MPFCSGSSSRGLRILSAGFLCLAFPWGKTGAEEKAGNRPISRLLFGSCLKQDQPAPIFEAILDREPELFVFLGDNIYADTTDMELMGQRYAQLGRIPGFIELKKRCPVEATWDDHDFGANDAGASYEKREGSEKHFLDFWEVPEDSQRRKREGIYGARIDGPVGRRLQLILLDTRYFRGPLKQGPERRVGGPYVPSDDPAVTLLGEAQWAWLEEQLKQPADLRILASSIQCVAEDAGQETWSNLPRERSRLFSLIRETKAEGILVISGDRHWAELSVEKENAPYPIYDFTSSSLNTDHGRGTPTENRFRHLPRTWHEANFGELAIDWSAEGRNVSLRLFDRVGKAVFEKVIPFAELRMPEVTGVESEAPAEGR